MQINLTPDYSLPVIMVIFLLNYLIVSKFFLRPINNVIERIDLPVLTLADGGNPAFIHEERIERRLWRGRSLLLLSAEAAAVCRLPHAARTLQ